MKKIQNGFGEYHLEMMMMWRGYDVRVVRSRMNAHGLSAAAKVEER